MPNPETKEVVKPIKKGCHGCKFLQGFCSQDYPCSDSFTNYFAYILKHENPITESYA